MPDLPPLNALRAFEVAARTGSFVLAGRELGVTAAAISAQVKALESHLGKQLFLRQGNRITLTDAGRAVYPRLEQALGDIAEVTQQVQGGRGRAGLVISVLPSVAEHWLIPGLHGFPAEGGLDLRIEDDPVILARDGADLRITYGSALYPDHRIAPLFTDRILPVCAPALALPDGIAGLPDRAFIHTDWGPSFATQPSWPAWLALARIRRIPDPGRGLRVGSTGAAIAAARAGLGVALVPERIAGTEIAAGRLIVPDPTALPMSQPYVLVWTHAGQNRRSLQALIGWLTSV